MKLRLATRADIAGMHVVRMAVRENRLTSRTLDESDYERAICVDGQGWVIEDAGEIVAFAVGNATDGNLWALFVLPEHERRGYGRRLLDTVVDWLFRQGLDLLWLTTSSGTRAAALYERAGWRRVGELESGELRYELRR